MNKYEKEEPNDFIIDTSVKTESRTIKSAPKSGKIARQDIKRAVRLVSNSEIQETMMKMVSLGSLEIRIYEDEDGDCVVSYNDVDVFYISHQNGAIYPFFLDDEDCIKLLPHGIATEEIDGHVVVGCMRIG